jgi:hypothetical protein
LAPRTLIADESGEFWPGRASNDLLIFFVANAPLALHRSRR